MHIASVPASWWSVGAWRWLWSLGAVGLALLGFADNAPGFSSPPCSVELFLILLCGGHPRLWAWYALAASVGEIVGGYVTYRLSEAGSQKTLEKKVGEATAARICNWFDKSAFATVFLGAIMPPPFPFTPVLMAAGIMRCPRKTFFSALTAGRGLRYFGLAWLSRSYGQRIIALMARNYRPAMYALIALGVGGGIAALIYYLHVRKRRAPDARSTPVGHKT